MASKIKISELPALTGTVADSYNIPIDDGSTTYKVSVAHFEEAAAHTASEYAAAAAVSAEAAAGSAGEAATTATTIETDIGTATRLVNDARGYASSAADSVTAAQAASGAATTKANEASNSANAAAGSAGEAAASATTASNYVTNAQAEANRAKSWADYPNATGASGDATHNAHYWADVAQAIAGGGVTSFNGRGGVVVPKAGDYSAAMISYDNTDSGLTATDAQAAIDEVNTDLNTLDTAVETLGDEVEAIKTDLSDYHVVPSRNKLENKAVGTTKDNIVFTVAADGIITGNGTAASPAVQYATLSITGGVVPNVWKGMKLSGCVNGSSSTHNYNVAYFNTQTGTQVSNDIVYTDGYTIKDYDYINIFARVVAGAQVTNATWKPMIETAEDYAADPSYEPYWECMRDGKLDIADNIVLGAANLCQITSATQTIDSVVFTVDTKANSIKINGTPNNNSRIYFPVNAVHDLTAGRFFLSGGFPNASSDTLMLWLRYRTKGTSAWNYAIDTGNGVWVDIADNMEGSYTIEVAKTYTANNVYIYPMLTTNEHTPNVPYAMTNRELTTVKAGTVQTTYYWYGSLEKCGNLCVLNFSIATGSSEVAANTTLATVPFKPKNAVHFFVRSNIDGLIKLATINTNGNISINVALPNGGNLLGEAVYFSY